MSFHRVVLYVAALWLAACAPPDVTPQINGFTSAVADADKAIAKDVNRAREKETEIAKQRAIARNEDVYSRPQACLEAAFEGNSGADRLATNPAACTLSPLFKVPKPRGSGSYVADAMDALRAYGKTLAALDGATVSGGVQGNFTDFLNAVNSLAEVHAADGAAPPLDATKIASAGVLTGAVVEARRGAIVKKLVEAAHPEVEVIIAEMIAYFDASDQLTSEAQALNTAFGAMSDAQGTPSYGTRVRAYEKAHDRYRKRLKASKAGKLILVWRQHQVLLAQVQSGSDLSSLPDLYKEIKVLTE